MSYTRQYRGGDDYGRGGRGGGSGATPGKRTRTEMLPVRPSGGGTPLPEPVRNQMEGSFGADFSGVRVHQGEHAAGMGALAYTEGNDIHFAPGQYDPGSRSGQELLGHELTHVVQQRQGRVPVTAQAKGVDLNDDPSLEQEADRMGAMAARGERVGMSAPAAAPSRPVVQGFFKLDKTTARKVAGTDGNVEFTKQVAGPNRNYLQNVEVPKVKPDTEEGNKDESEKDEEKKYVTKLVVETTKKIPALRISDDGYLAVQDVPGNVDAKTFFIQANKIAESNDQLTKVKSAYQLRDLGNKLTVPDIKGQPQVLNQVVGEKAKDKGEFGNELLGPSQCIAMAERVTGGFGQLQTNTRERPKPSERNLGNELGAYVSGYGLSSEKQDPEKQGQKQMEEVAKVKPADTIQWPEFEVTLEKGKTYEKVKQKAKKHKGVDGQEMFKIDQLTQEVDGSFTVGSGYGKKVEDVKDVVEDKLTKHRLIRKDKPLYDDIEDLHTPSNEMKITSIEGKGDDVWKRLLDLEDSGGIGSVARTKEVVKGKLLIVVKSGVAEQHFKLVENRNNGSRVMRIPDDKAIALINDKLAGLVRDPVATGKFNSFDARFYEGEVPQNLYHKALDQKLDEKSVAEHLGVNEYASPEVGGAFTVAPVGNPNEEKKVWDVERNDWKKPPAPYHFAGVVAKSGADTITLENYARGAGEEMGSESDPRSYFAMYGPLKVIEIVEDKVRAKKKQPKDKWKEGTFHGEWKGTYPNAVTAAFEPNVGVEKKKEDD